MSQQGIVAAIDLGTCNTRLAFGIKHENYSSLSDIELIIMNDWKRAPQSGGAQMAPTSILLNGSGDVLAYGWDAEGRFTDLKSAETRSYYLFKHFKMKLHQMEHFSENDPLEAVNGGSLQAMIVFSKALEYLSDLLVEFANKRAKFAVVKKDICWVLTVPAIWKPGARHFMRNAALKAGMCDKHSPDKFVIALEPECAALSVRATTDRYQNTVAPQAYTSINYAVVDCGGGTVDIAYHKVENTYGEKFVIKELLPPSGGPFGGSLVDKQFEQLLNDIFGRPKETSPHQTFCDGLKSDFTAAWIELMKQFEIQKSVLDSEGDQKLYFSIDMLLVRAVSKITGKNVLDILEECSIPAVALSANDSLEITADRVRAMYKRPVTELCTCLQNDLHKPQLKKVDTLYMVGTFSMSSYLLAEVKQSMKDIIMEGHVVNPPNSQLSIVKGAIMYGINPAIIQERIAPLSYGILCLRHFNPSVHHYSKQVEIDGILHCDDLYDEFLKKGQIIRIPSDGPHKRTYVPVSAMQTAMSIRIYSADTAVQYVTDPGCHLLATIHVDMPDTTGGKNRNVEVEIEYSGTEIHFQCTDVNTQKNYSGYVDFHFEQ